MRAINKSTLGVIKHPDVVLLMDPDAAAMLAQSQEIHTYLKESPFALAQIRGDVPSQNGVWGLPDQLYTVKLVVDDTVVVTSKKGAATTTYQYALNFLTNKALYLVSRPGGLEGVEGGPAFSTLMMFAYEEMTMETLNDADNRRVLGSVVTDFSMLMTSDKSAYKITNCIA
jgi:hypothetical protein